MCDHCGCRQGVIGELMDQHERIKALADDLRRELACENYVAARTTLGDLVAVLRPHVAWEEAGLFARVTASGDFADHVVALEAEHASLDAQLAAAEYDSSRWAGAILALLDDLDRHIYSENYGLFPGAIAVLDGDDWDAIEAAKPAAVLARPA